VENIKKKYRGPLGVTYEKRKENIRKIIRGTLGGHRINIWKT